MENDMAIIGDYVARSGKQLASSKRYKKSRRTAERYKTSVPQWESMGVKALNPKP